MSVNISVVCFKSKTLSNGEHPLFVKVSEGKKRATKSLGLSIRAQFWNFEKNEPKKICPNREALMKMIDCLLYTSPSPRDRTRSRMPSSA